VGAVGVFFLLPRMSAGYLGGYSFGTDLSTGFSDHVQLGQIGQIQQSNAVVMHVQIEGDNLGRYDLHWRGVSLSEFDGHGWSNARQQFVLDREPGGAFAIPSFGTRVPPKRTAQSVAIRGQLARANDSLSRPDGADRDKRLLPGALGTKREGRLQESRGRPGQRGLRSGYSASHHPLRSGIGYFRSFSRAVARRGADLPSAGRAHVLAVAGGARCAHSAPGGGYHKVRLHQL
jgi:hypothetical protein